MNREKEHYIFHETRLAPPVVKFYNLKLFIIICLNLQVYRVVSLTLVLPPFAAIVKYRLKISELEVA